MRTLTVVDVANLKALLTSIRDQARAISTGGLSDFNLAAIEVVGDAEGVAAILGIELPPEPEDEEDEDI